MGCCGWGVSELKRVCWVVPNAGLFPAGAAWLRAGGVEGWRLGDGAG